MRPTHQIFITILLTGIAPTAVAVLVAVFFAAGLHAFLWASIIIIGIIFAAFLIWWLQPRPRLFWYHTLVTHWPLLSGIAIASGFLLWIQRGFSTGQTVTSSLAWDAVLIAVGLMTSGIIIAWRLPLLWIALTPSKMVEEQIQTDLRYLGKEGDYVGRGSSRTSDNHEDAKFELVVTPMSQHVQKVIVDILMQQTNSRWIPTHQQWTAQKRWILWGLAIFSETRQPLNPIGAPLSCTTNGETMLYL